MVKGLKILLVLFILNACNDVAKIKAIPKFKKEKKTDLKVTKLQTKKKKIVVADSLNHENPNAFFKEYGKTNTETIVEFSTRLGNFTFQLYKDTPIHRANFIFLAKKGYFDTTSFHRLVPNFVAQFGNSDKMATVNFRNKYKNYRLKPEFRKNRKHYRATLAVARDWEYNPDKLSTPFEFYIVQSKNPQHHLNFEHTVLGKVIKGMSVIDEIILEKADKDDWPFKDIDIKVVSVR